ncbi:MAG: 50S ribosomal protein L23 [Candidatus Paceibacterota bacterium]|jgi:large subunit ribosomal protein L23
MAIFKKKEEKIEAPKETKKEIKKEEPKEAKQPRATKGFSFAVLKAPHVTEKASDLTEKNQYVFEVWPKTNKIEIKKAVKDLYNVDAVSVKIINIHSKERRVGRTIGTKQGYKKAIVSLKKGQKIEILPR